MYAGVLCTSKSVLWADSAVRYSFSFLTLGIALYNCIGTVYNYENIHALESSTTYERNPAYAKLKD